MLSAFSMIKVLQFGTSTPVSMIVVHTRISKMCIRDRFKPPALVVGMVIKQKEKREGYRKKVKKGEKKGENPLEKHAPHGV